MSFQYRQKSEKILADSSLFIISDIHANLPALEAVLKNIPDNAQIICAGDIVGYYTEPNEVCELLRRRGASCIRGNHDLYVLNLKSFDPGRDSMYRSTWTSEQLNRANREWLESLPDFLDFSVEKKAPDKSGAMLPYDSMLLRHGSLTDAEEYIYPDTQFRYEQIPGRSVLVLGHTHHPMLRRSGSSCIVNPGSIGQPRDRDPKASFASVDLMSGAIEFFRLEYDVAGYQKRLVASDVAPQAIDILSLTK